MVAKKKLTEEDGQELQRIRRVLCITNEAANEVRGRGVGGGWGWGERGVRER